jgi:O-methyltransferase
MEPANESMAMISFFEKLQRHGLVGIPRLIPINIRYYLDTSVKRYFKYSLGRYAPGLYDYFWQLGNPGERAAIQRFIETAPSGTTRERKAIAHAMREVHKWVDCQHLQEEMLEVITRILNFPRHTGGVVVEAGTFKGGSAAKISHACAVRDRRLIIFDSFQGIPDNDEPHNLTIFGDVIGSESSPGFARGVYQAPLAIVKDNIQKYGKIEVCEFVKGWFEDTMPNFVKPIIVAYIDVDLASSTRTCIKFLFPRLVPGGIIFSQDGHLPLVIKVLDDDEFWRTEVGIERPRMVGLGSSKLVQIWKD